MKGLHIADYCNEKDPTNKRALDFIHAHLADAQAVADELGVHVEDILGLSATECAYGTSNIATVAKKFFGMHAGAPGNIGTYTTAKGAKVSKYLDFKSSAESFAERFGDLVSGKQGASEFVEALIPKFNTANAKTKGNPSFRKDTLNGIHAIAHLGPGLFFHFRFPMRWSANGIHLHQCPRSDFPVLSLTRWHAARNSAPV